MKMQLALFLIFLAQTSHVSSTILEKLKQACPRCSQGSNLEGEEMGCGRQAGGFEPDLIVNHQSDWSISKKHSWPWFIGLRVKRHYTISFCPAILLSDKVSSSSSSFLLTTANCAVDIDDIEGKTLGVDFDPCTSENEICEIRAISGRQDMEKEEEEEQQIGKVHNIYLHPNLHCSEKGRPCLNNVAILKVKPPFQFTDNTRPICSPMHTMESAPVNRQCVVTAWANYDAPPVSRGTRLLIQSKLQVLEEQQSSQLLSNRIIHTDPEITNITKFHGTNGGVLSCQDSSGIWKVHGLLPLWKKGRFIESLNVYSDWIKETINGVDSGKKSLRKRLKKKLGL